MKHAVTFVPFMGYLNFGCLYSDLSLSFRSVKGA